MLDLSIIIVNFNKSKLLKDCLDSIYKNSKSIKFEIFVVDNGSKDNSVSMIKENFPQIKLIENSSNLGFAKANNQAIKLSQGKYILLLNNDTKILNNALKQMVEFMTAHPNTGGLGPKLLNPDLTSQREGSLLSKRFWNSKTPIETNFLTGAALMIRRGVFEKVGLLDENFFFYNEDIDICRRIKKAGWKLYFLPSAQIIHIGQQTKNIEMIYEGYRGGLHLCKKHYNKFINIIYRLGVLADVSISIAHLPLKFMFSRNTNISQEFTQYKKVIKEIFTYDKKN